MKRIVIIGGGISGLATAHRLIELSQSSNTPIKLTLLEGSSRLGGTIQTGHRDGFLIERGPDSFISEKPEAVALAKRLGLESQLIETNQLHRRSFIVNRGRLSPVPEGFQLLAPSRIWPFINTDIFSLGAKLRMAADLLIPRKSQNGKTDESLAEFVRRRLGREALERMAQPMVGGIYTANPESLSLRATLPRFLDIERDHRSLILGMWRLGRKNRNLSGVSGARYSLFLSFAEGTEVLVKALEKRLRESDVEIRLRTPVSTLRQSNNSWQLFTQTKEIFEADALCVALPAYAAASLLGNTAPRLSSLLNEIKFASTATVNLAYRREAISHPLDGFGFVVPFIEKRSLIACTFSSVKFAGRAPTDHVLLRAFVGGALQPEMFALDESEIVERVQTDLKDLVGVKGRPLFTEVNKWRKSMPQYEVGHLQRVDEIESSVSELPNFTLAGNSYRGAGIPDCVKSGEAAAAVLMASGR